MNEIKKMTDNLKKFLINLEEDNTLMELKKLIDSEISPKDILEAVKEGMLKIGELWKAKEYFVPEVIYGAEISNQIMTILTPLLENHESSNKKGFVLVGTVQGDIHDIGKNIFISLLQAEDYEVFDMGVDLTPEIIVDFINEKNPDILGLSGLLTIALTSMKDTIDAIVQNGLREKLKIIIGGPFLTSENCRFIGADGFTRNASEGIEIIKGWME